MRQNAPRIVLAGTNSGCGKTTVTCAVLKALVNRGMKVGAFKCGPDYIDPMFHSRIIGTKSTNLDPFFFDENTLRFLLAKNSADCDVSVIEGVMGFYDGLSLSSPKGSTFEVAQTTQSPVVLVVDAKGAALSVLATLHGFITLYPDSGIRGVILNQCSAMLYPQLAEEIHSRLGVQPLGFLPRLKDCALKSRHLGLVTADEVADLRGKLRMLAEQAEKTMDLNTLLELANGAEPIACEPVALPRFHERVRIAVAKDAAFCFYYEDSLAVLREMGAELILFSPIADPCLPDDIHGLYLGGGYPELYADKLSKNTTMRRSILAALRTQTPCIAECGGFMYLTQAIAEHPMVGFLKGRCFDNRKLTRFGYVTLRAKCDCMLCRAGETIAAHEFHHWDCEQCGVDFVAQKPSGRTWGCIYADAQLYAGYPHLHFLSNPNFAQGFYRACIKEKHKDD